MARGFFGPRFGLEATFIVAVALVAGLLELSLLGIAAAVFASWIVVAVSEYVIARRTPEPVVEAAPEPSLAPERGLAFEPDFTSPPPPPVAAEPPPEPAPEPEPETEPRPEPEVEQEAEPEPEPEPAPPPALAAAPEPPAEPVSDEPVTEPVPVVAQLRPSAPQEWNLWELERRARERAGADPVLDDEVSYLLLYLREFAGPDGDLPLEFDPLVRESFGDLIWAER